MKVEAILAHSTDFVIGKGDDMAWHHSGDFKRFKKITMGHNLLMGARTFLGIARNHFSKEPGLEVLPGRTIFIIGTPREPLGDRSMDEFRQIYKRGYGSDWTQLVHEIIVDCRTIGIDRSNVRIINEDGDPQSILNRIEMNHLSKGETLFIAGGAKTYHKYLPFASTVHRTVIDTTVADDLDLVRLTPETISYLNDIDYRTGFVKNSVWSAPPINEGEEICKDLKATYLTQVK